LSDADLRQLPNFGDRRKSRWGSCAASSAAVGESPTRIRPQLHVATKGCGKQPAQLRGNAWRPAGGAAL